MAVPNTSYNVGSIDLSRIFNRYTSGPKASTTNFKSNNQDLNEIFEPLTTSQITFNTGYIVKNYAGVIGSDKDLSLIFESFGIHFLTVTGAGTSFIKTTINGRAAFILTAGSSGTLNTSKNSTLNFVVVGGGASSTAGSLAIGGRGGGTVYGRLNLLPGTNYTFTIGASNANTTLGGGSINITAYGGSGQTGGGTGVSSGLNIISSTIGSGGNGGYFSNSGSAGGATGTYVLDLNSYYGGGGGGGYSNGGLGGGGNGVMSSTPASPGGPNTGGGAGGSFSGGTILGGTGVIILYL